MNYTIRHIFINTIRLMVTMVAILFAAAPETYAYSPDRPTLLVISSYNDSEAWSEDLMRPLVRHVASIPGVDCDIYYMNVTQINDLEEFNSEADNLMAGYANNHPKYVVMIGNFAFNLRDRIVQEWGAVPMLLYAKTTDTAPLNQYFKSDLVKVGDEEQNNLINYQKYYNFTSVVSPDCYKETVDLMMSMIPDMERFVFCSDSVFVNRVLAEKIGSYVQYEYPNVEYQWLKANSVNAESLRAYMVDRDPNLGLLMSSWNYSVEYPNGTIYMNPSDVKQISSSKNPVFALREPYMKLGAVGGAYTNIDAEKEILLAYVDSMIAGVDMATLPFYSNDSIVSTLNFMEMQKYGLKEHNCPENTVLLMRPETFFEKYFWQTLLIFILLVAALAFLAMKTSLQRKRMIELNRNTDLINNMPVAYSTAEAKLTPSGRLITVTYLKKNTAFEQLLAQNARRDNPRALFVFEFISEKIEIMMKEKKAVAFPYHFEHTDRYYDFILCPDRTCKRGQDSSVIFYYDIFAVEITNRVKMANELRDATRKLDITLAAADIVPFQYDMRNDIFMLDSHRNTDNNTITVGNITFEKRFALSDLMEKVHPEDQHKILDLIFSTGVSELGSMDMSFRCKGPDGDFSEWGEIVGASVEVDPKTNDKYLLGALRSVTKRKKREVQMAQALEKASESDRMKTAFLANISHEIRTPLNAIVGFSSVIADTESAELRKEYSELVNRNNDQLLALINDVLDMSQIEANMVNIEPEACDVNSLMQHVKHTMQSKVPENVSFNLILDRSECTAVLDFARMSQVLTKLVANACKFTHEGSINLGYEVLESDTEQRIYFYVSDSGIGIPADVQKKLFTYFYKADTFVSGTGLGLAICRTIVEKMGGEISVESEGEGCGSHFSFWVPFKKANA